MNGLISAANFVLVFLYTLPFLGHAYGFPAKGLRVTRNARELRSFAGVICPPGTSSESCFYNKLYLYLSLEDPQQSDSRSIGKRSPDKGTHHPIDDLDYPTGRPLNDYDIENLIEYFELISKLDEGEEYDHNVQDFPFTDWEHRNGDEVASLQFDVDANDKPTSPKDLVLDYLLNTKITKTSDNIPSVSTLRKRTQASSNSHIHKRQFACKGDKYQCFLKNLQYIIDIQNTMSKA